MGLTSSYEQFLRNRTATKTVFTAAEAEGPDDSATFSQRSKSDAERGLVRCLKSGDAVEVTKLASAFALYGSKVSSSTETPSLDAENASAAEVAKTPWRVDLSVMKKQVESIEYIHPDSIPHMTIAVVLLKNGYALQGMSAPADPANFNLEKGREFAYEDALRKLWPLEAYVMREYLSKNIEIHDPQERWAST